MTTAYGLWILIFIHLMILCEVFIFCCFKQKRSSQILNVTSNLDNGKTAETSMHDDTSIMRFPKFSLRIYLITLKVKNKQKNHLFFKIFFRNLSKTDGILEVISHNIVLIGVLGISGIIFKAWENMNVLVAGVLAAVLARIFHFFYSSLQVKQSVLFINLSSEDKLVVAVETEVMRRLNVHRTMRRVLGYLIMLLYYIGNLYYTLRYVVIFKDPVTFYWLSSFLIGFAVLLLVLEPFKVVMQIEAVNYLKSGGSKTIEALSRFLASEELLSSFN